MSQQMTVNPNSTIHIDAIELNEEPLTRQLTTLHLECLRIPPDTTGQSASTCARRMTGIEIAFYGPVVRQIELSPAIRLLGFFNSHLVVKDETPVFVEALTLPGFNRQDGT